MKPKSLLITILFLAILIGCKKKEETKDPNVLGVDPNIELGQVNNTFVLSSKFGNTPLNLNEDIKIISNNNGLATIKIKANVNQALQLKQLLDKSPLIFMIIKGILMLQLSLK